MTKDDILRRYSMKEILSRHGIKLNAAGFCRCPFHAGDNTPSLKVYPNNSWYCFGCEKGGDVIKFVQLIDGLSFADACKWISGEGLSPTTRRKITAGQLAVQAERKKAQRDYERECELTDRVAMWRMIMENVRQETIKAQGKSREAVWAFADIYAMAYNEWALAGDKLDRHIQRSIERKHRKANRKK